MKKIDGQAKSIRQLLSGVRYFIDYYQREYRWQQKHMRELLDDLTDRFLQDHKPTDPREAVENYGHYFLGSIIISQKNNQSFIIDGQQRLTSLTLLLMYLHNRLGTSSEAGQLADMIFSKRYGTKSFNIDVTERTAAMEAMYTQEPFDVADQPESVRTIVARYHDIESLFPAEIDDAAVPYFVDWLIENVYLVEISAGSDEDAYTIFETMNDRGLSLTPLDMFKGYLLANITDQPKREAANKLWKDRLQALAEMGKEEDADAFKAWLRSQYAQTIRERKKNATPGDFDRLGTEFHRWIREHEKEVGLQSSADFVRFIERDMNFYTRQYLRIRKASWNLEPELESIFYNANHGFTLQYPLLLAPLRPIDDQATVDRKLRIVAAFVDILLARRLWNFRSISYSTMQYSMFLVMRDIGGKSVEDLIPILRARLEQEQETFASNDGLALHQQNRRVIHHLLARLTDHVGRKSGEPTRFGEYTAEGKNRYEIEHIWANHPSRHRDEFRNDYEFGEYRNRIGGLLLLPKSFNASYGDMTYAQKHSHYNTQNNMLVRSLHAQAYDHNPKFLQYMNTSGLPFKPHPQFKQADLDARQDLYRRIAEEVWSVERLDREALS